jgi:cell wall-associated NlpC family hydrolase
MRTGKMVVLGAFAPVGMVVALLTGVSLSPPPTLTFGNPALAAAWQKAHCYYDELVAAATNQPAGSPTALAVGCSLNGADLTAIAQAIDAWNAPKGFEQVKNELMALASDLTGHAPAATIAGLETTIRTELQELQAQAGPVPSNPGSATQMTALYWAESELGVPYVWGGESEGTAFDCSGLVQWAFARAGVNLPRGAADQYAVGPPVSPGSTLVAGDLVFFHVDADGPGIGHVGIYVGGGWMIDAPHAGAVVRFEQFSPTNRPMPGQPWGDGASYVGATDPGATS